MTIYRPNYIQEMADQLRADGQAAPGWVFTDHPFYAVQAGLVVPPPIAVLSRKRLESGTITREMLRDVLKEYEPPYVLLERFTYDYGPGGDRRGECALRRGVGAGAGEVLSPAVGEGTA